MVVLLNSRLGRYEIRSQIGAGGMGDVYIAHDSLLGRNVALKVLPPEFAREPDRLVRFEREVRTASALNHPNIVSVFDVGEQSGTHYIVTELIDGLTLRDWVANARPSLAHLTHAVRQAALALGAAHRAGIVHRDIKPENLMRRKDGLVKVLDFGVSKVIAASDSAGRLADEPDVTTTGAVVGTARYMSPEQAQGEAIDGRTDIWSLGVVLYELAAGRPPFDKDSLTATLLEIVSREPISFSSLVPHASEALCSVVERAMRKKRTERFQTADEMAEALEAAVGSAGWAGEAVTTALFRVRPETGAASAVQSLDRSGPSGSGPKRTSVGSMRWSAAAAGAVPPTNLRPRRFKLIGRTRELSEITSLLKRPEERMLTLTGPGGTGKTSLAMEAGRQLLDGSDFPDGVYFVDLSALTDHKLIGQLIGLALDVVEAPGSALSELLRREVSGKRMLFVLDNFEHLLDGAMFVSELLEISRQLKVIVTSRAPLRLIEEREYAVEPLEIPVNASLPPLDELARVPAVDLFVERARLASPNFVLTAGNARIVAEICRKLDGLPLALELAAARVKLLTPSAMLERLDHRLRLLTGGARDLPSRQQTMSGAVEWSYDLLDEKERAVLRALAVFAGGCTLGAAQAVCGRNGDDVLDILGSLVDNSLVKQREQEDGQARFSMLEVVREYAAEKLEAANEADAVRLAFARYFKQMVEAADTVIRSGNQIAAVRKLTREQENLTAALTILMRTRPHEGAALVGSMQSFWSAQGYCDYERRIWLERALKVGDLPPKLRARLLNGLTRCEVHLGRPDKAVTHGREAVAVARSSGCRDVLSITLAGFGHALSVAGELDEARNAFARAAELAREMESSHALTVALGSLGEVARLAGDLEAASEYYEQALEAGGRHARSNPIAIILANLGGVSIEKQNFKAARGYYRESLGIAVELQNTLWSAVAIDGLAAVALDAGDIERSALLAGAAEALHESSRSAAEKWELSLRDRYVESLRSLLDEETLKKLWSRGRNMTLSEATTAALES